VHKFWIWWATLSDGEKLALFVVAIVLIVWLGKWVLRGGRKPA